MVYLTGYGFSLWRGGPMFYADTLGLSAVERAMRKYSWLPAERVTELATSDGRFNT